MPGSTYRILVALCLTLGITACGEPQQVEVTHIVEQTTIVIQTVVVDEVVRQDITATPKPMLEDTITPYTASNQSIIGHWYNPGTGEEIKFLANGLLVNGVSVARYAISADGTHCTRKALVGASNDGGTLTYNFASTTTPIEIHGDELILDTTTRSILVSTIIGTENWDRD